MTEFKPTKTIIMIPTYNERENIIPLIDEILALDWAHSPVVLVVDDDSPDGTGDLVKARMREDPRIRLLTRTKKRGRGAAGIDGFKAALDSGADAIIEMDADFSHQPKFIPALLAGCRDADLVIGSRFIPGGKDLDRGVIRKVITLLARNFIRRRFRLPVQDVSSGFRCFRREVLEKVDVDDMVSFGPSIVLEVLYKAHRLNFRMKEIPIVFIDRAKGSTKLNLLLLLETLLMAMIFKKRYPPLDGSRTP